MRACCWWNLLSRNLIGGYGGGGSGGPKGKLWNCGGGRIFGGPRFPLVTLSVDGAEVKKPLGFKTGGTIEADEFDMTSPFGDWS